VVIKKDFELWQFTLSKDKERFLGCGEGRVQEIWMARVSSTLPWIKYILCTCKATD